MENEGAVKYPSVGATEERGFEKYNAAEDSIKQASRSRRKEPRMPNEADYPTKLYVSVCQLLNAQYVQELIEQELALDAVATEAIIRLISLLEAPEYTLKLGRRTVLHLPSGRSKRQALIDALDHLDAAIKQCQSSYHAFSDFQKRSIAQSMKQQLWPQLAIICNDLGNANMALLRHTSDQCPRCSRCHKAKLCFAVHHGQELIYSLRVQLVENPVWDAIRLELTGNNAAGRGITQPLEELQSLCHMLRSERRTICLVDQGRQFQAYVSSAEHPALLENRANMISLRQWISNGSPMEFSKVSRRSRMVLALLLAYYYLHLSGSALWPDGDVTPDVWFETVGDQTLDLYRPFVTLRYKSTERHTVDGKETFNNPERPSLPALGKLLLEIWLGRALDWDGVLSAEGLPEFHENDIGALFYAAVARCWTSKFIRSRGLLIDNQAMRDEYESWVVKGLQYILELYQVRYNDVFSNTGGRVTTATSVARTLRSTIYTIPEIGLLRRDFDEDTETEVEGSEVRPLSSSENTHQMCLHEDGRETPIDLKDKISADAWFSDLRTRVHPFLATIRGNQKKRDAARVKVAVLDTGTFLEDLVRSEGIGKRIIEYRSWCSSPSTADGVECAHGEDNDGHGTQSASILLDVASQCRVYVGKVFDGRQHNDNHTDLNAVTQERIARAIRYAANRWKVDMITMSFGFDKRCPLIEREINDATSKGVLMFASASNYGALRPITFPANHDKVICIHAMTGKGRECDITTTGKKNSDNFATVGSTVRTWTWSASTKRNVERYCSGSSVATPIAAGIAACVVEMMRCARRGYLEKCTDERRSIEEQRYDDAMAALRQKDGMEAVFRLIVGHTGQRGQYSFLAPAMFMCEQRAGHDTTRIDNILRAIEER